MMPPRNQNPSTTDLLYRLFGASRWPSGASRWLQHDPLGPRARPEQAPRWPQGRPRALKARPPTRPKRR
eukprot:593140-Pyramimonas_sp.AAC.1